VNPVHLVFSQPSLKITSNGEELSIVCGNQQAKIFNNEEASYLWKASPHLINDLINNDGCFSCTFSIKFKTKDDEEAIPEDFTKDLSMKITKCLFSVDVTITSDEPKKGRPCTAHVHVRKLDTEISRHFNICMKMNQRDHFWRLNSPDDTLKLDFVDDVTEISRDIEITCNASGIINSPLLSLCYVDSVQKGEESAATDVVVPFGADQVHYLSAAKMVKVGDVTIETDV